MKFSVKKCTPEKESSSCIIVGVFETYRLSRIAKQLDSISNGYISAIVGDGELKGKIGQTLLLYHVPNILSKRILLVGCGKENELDESKYKKIVQKTINTLNKTGSIEAVWFLTELDIKNRNHYWKIRQTIENIKETLYVFNQLKSNKHEPQRALRKIIFHIPREHDFKNCKHAISHGLAVAIGIKSAKDLANMPPNICNAAYLGSLASKLANNYPTLTIKLIGEAEMKKLAMNAYLAVGQGSQNESILSIIEYKGNNDSMSKPIVLVGKGLTFDSGGVSIKPPNSMDEMKYDMCGAASVYGIMHFVAELKLPINVIGVLAGCENMPSSKAYRPGDILTSMSGQTIEVLNTDAEGRLVLCDTLTYIERFKPDVVIDIATLTGACIIALGNHYSGLMSNHDPLANELLHAAEETGDKVWRLPLSQEFCKELESNFADLANIGGRTGGAITAACFLERFATKYHWAHLDIAGTAWKSGKTKGATGRPVALLAQFLLNRAQLHL